MTLGPDANVDDASHIPNNDSVTNTELGRIMILKGYSVLEVGGNSIVSIAPPPVTIEYQSELGEGYCF